MSAFIVTLASYIWVRGLVLAISGGRSAQDLAPAIRWFGIQRLLGLPLTAWIAIACFVVFSFIMAKTPLRPAPDHDRRQRDRDLPRRHQGQPHPDHRLHAGRRHRRPRRLAARHPHLRRHRQSRHRPAVQRLRRGGHRRRQPQGRRRRPARRLCRRAAAVGDQHRDQPDGPARHTTPRSSTACWCWPPCCSTPSSRRSGRGSHDRTARQARSRWSSARRAASARASPSASPRKAPSWCSPTSRPRPAQATADELGAAFIAHRHLADWPTPRPRWRWRSRRHGRLDIIVQNAGIYPWQLIENTSADDWDRVMAVNLRGTLPRRPRRARADEGAGLGPHALHLLDHRPACHQPRPRPLFGDARPASTASSARRRWNSPATASPSTASSRATS